jgi:hypothetical protein
MSRSRRKSETALPLISEAALLLISETALLLISEAALLLISEAALLLMFWAHTHPTTQFGVRLLQIGPYRLPHPTTQFGVAPGNAEVPLGPWHAATAPTQRMRWRWEATEGANCRPMQEGGAAGLPLA